MLGCLLVSTYGKVLFSDEGIKLVLFDGKLLVTILGNVDDITIEIDVGTDLGSLDGSLGGSNDVNLEGLLLVDSLVYTGGKVL